MSERTHATVTRVEPFYCLALDDFGQSYMLPSRNFQGSSTYDFSYVVIGSRVEFIPIEGPKGMRGIEIRVVSV